MMRIALSTGVAYEDTGPPGTEPDRVQGPPFVVLVLAEESQVTALAMARVYNALHRGR